MMQKQALAHQNFKIKSIENSAGILFQNLGKAEVSNQEYNLLSFYNLTHINKQLSVLNNYYIKSLNICTYARSEHYTFNCKNQLKYIDTKILAIRQAYRTVSHQLKTNSSLRKRRGIFDGIGNGLKYLFGVPDASDADFYTDSINSLISNQKQTETLMQQQVTIISQTITNFNASLNRMNENINILNKNLQDFNKFANEVNLRMRLKT